MNDKYLAELRENLRRIVTRDGNTARIPEILERELDELVSFIATALAKQDRESRLDEYEYIKTHKRQKHPVPNSVGFTECIPTGPLIERIKGLRAELTSLTKEPAPEEEKRRGREQV